MMKLALLFAGLVTSTALQATPVYDNTTTDTLDTVVYSTGAYTEIGDQIHLAGTERSATSATAQLYNLGSGGSFDATLNLYGVVAGNPGVGSLLGSFTAAGQVLASNGILDVNWLLAGLALPDDLFFTVSLGNVLSGMDLGLNVFNPPTIGSSSGQFLIVNGSSGFAQASTGSGHDNIYFRLDAASANAVPEPGSAGLVLLAMLPLMAIRSRRALSR